MQVRRRQAAVAAARSFAATGGLPSAPRVPFVAAAPIIWRRQGDELEALLEAVAKVATPGEAADEALGRALSAISETAGLLETYSVRRPTASRLELLRLRSSALSRATELYLAALTAETPLEAQTAATKAQQEIDRSVALKHEFDQVRDAAKSLLGDGDLSGAVERLISTLQVQHGGAPISDLDIIGRGRFERVTGSVAAPTAGVSFLGQELAARAHLDESAWAATLTNAVRVIAAHREEFAAAFGQHRIRRDFLKASSLWMEAYAQATLLTRPGSSPDGVVRQLVKVYANLIEDVVAPLGALMLIGTDPLARDYTRLMAKDATDVAERAYRAPELVGVFPSAERGYRNAASHGGHCYHVDGDDVVFQLRTFSERVPLEVLMDHVLALTEAVAAIHLALDNQLLRCGYTDHRPTDLGLYQPSMEALIRLGLEMHGMSLESAEVHADTLAVTVVGGEPPCFPIAAAVLTIAPSHIESVEVRHSFGFRSRRLSVSRPVLREYTEAEGEDPVWRTVLASASCLVDGARWLSGDRMRAAVAAIAWAALQSESLEPIPRLRKVRSWALERGDTEAADLISETIRALRMGDVRALRARPVWPAWLHAAPVELP